MRAAAICTSTPKPPPAPVMRSPTILTPEVVDQASIDTNVRERRRLASLTGRKSTILAGAGMPPTSGAKTLLGA